MSRMMQCNPDGDGILQGLFKKPHVVMVQRPLAQLAPSYGLG